MVESILTDRELVLQISEGSHKAFEIVFTRFYPRTNAFLAGFLKSKKEAEDLTQDIFVKLWNDREKMTDVQNLGAFIYVIARNALYNYVEAKQVRDNYAHHISISELDSSTPHEDLIVKDLQLLIDMAIDRMPSQRRAIFKMSRMKGLSNQEIAQELGLTKKTVENHLNLALKELKNVIMTICVFFC